eukprot:COSAG01_NODE_4987_length_4568_cov_2.236966_3_plen_79_part_00
MVGGVNARVPCTQALGIACQHGHLEAVQLLIGANADLNKCDLDGRSPCFHAAVSTVRVRVGIIGRPIGPWSGLAEIPA